MSHDTSRLHPDEWLEQHADALFRYARLRVREDAVAEDLVQETFLAGLRGREKFAGQSSERTWLISILRNKIMDHYRGQKAASICNPTDFLPDNTQISAETFWRARPPRWPGSPEESLENSEFQDCLAACIEKLPSPSREIFCLRELDGISTEKICKLFVITPSNLWTVIHRAKLQLRNCLSENWFSERGPHSD